MRARSDVRLLERPLLWERVLWGRRVVRYERSRASVPVRFHHRMYRPRHLQRTDSQRERPVRGRLLHGERLSRVSPRVQA